MKVGGYENVICFNKNKILHICYWPLFFLSTPISKQSSLFIVFSTKLKSTLCCLEIHVPIIIKNVVASGTLVLQILKRYQSNNF